MSQNDYVESNEGIRKSDIEIEPPIAVLPLSTHRFINTAGVRVGYSVATDSDIIELDPFKGLIPANGSLEVTVRFTQAHKENPKPIEPNTDAMFLVQYVHMPEKFLQEKKKLVINYMPFFALLPPSGPVDEETLEQGMQIEPVAAVFPSSEHEFINRTAHRLAFRVTTSTNLIHTRPYGGFIEPHGRVTVRVGPTKKFYSNPEPIRRLQRFKVYYTAVPPDTKPDETARSVCKRAPNANMLKLYVIVPRDQVVPQPECSSPSARTDQTVSCAASPLQPRGNIKPTNILPSPGSPNPCPPDGSAPCTLL